eukprot:TRINITY_DN3774_c0_g1_i1.p1 TRINITY_DN3774_c0_g1~~TRINITY_DN3774_c0_g1_i1.p1  ORF type:complete len:364 (+),score=65.72 TRINITY_DN3774_c0_g1_i1:160-1251(+)
MEKREVCLDGPLSKDIVLERKDSLKELKREYYLKNKSTLNLKNKLYRIQNKELLQQKYRNYNRQNRDTRRQHSSHYYLLNKSDINQRRREAYQLKKKAINEQQRHYYHLHKQAIQVHHTRYYLKNKETINLRKRTQRHDNKDRRVSNPRPKGRWTNPLQMAAFFGRASQLLGVREPMEWYRVSCSQVGECGGGGLYGVFGNLGKALQWVYPEWTWERERFSESRKKKSSQRWLRVTLQKLLPLETLIVEDYLHPDLLWDTNTGQKMELDIWVPSYNLALEYQGEQHYHEFSIFNKSLALYIERDKKKKKSCEEKSITLVTVPYWWDRQSTSLATTLHTERPDIFPPSSAPGIPPSPHPLLPTL